ncbi:PH domain-containing protein [Paraclostridium bifermentans]|uniref:PH domain-containing protein n=1 Tax=Paraclostridium TaxID=1849822 RepID=UPI001CC77F88|nr:MULTISPECIES: PH domain-containing protein [Paraclostridium]MBZ6005722.1 PH domain-containing protein [Paraclostridium bifermentans]MDU0297117.1 PH domain-containing protein [Paraclostridium sp. MRS3W1]
MNEELNDNKTNYENKSFTNENIKIRNNWKSLIYKLIKGTISNFGLGVLFIVFLKQWFWIAIVLFVVLEIIFSIIGWKYEYISIKDNEIHYYKGIFSKETLIIPKKSFKSMDISQNLIERLLAYKIVKIESPSKDFGIDDIKMSLNNEQIDILKSFSLNNLNKECLGDVNEEYVVNNIKDNEESKEIKEKKIETKKLVIYGFTSFNLFVALIFIFNILGKLDDFISSDYLSNIIDGAFKNNSQSMTILLIVAGLLIFLIILKLIATVYYVVKYYNFTLLKENNNIKIAYGLFSTKEFSFKDNNIKLIKIKSNPIRQFLNIYELNLIIKGYTGEGNEKIIMYPIGSLNEINDVIKEFIPEWSFKGTGNGIEKGKFSILIKPVLLIFITSIVCYLILKTQWVWFINLTIILTLINSALKIRNLNISVDNKKVRAVNGGLFRTIHILRGRDIQAVEFKTNPIQSKNNVGKITIDYYSESSEEIKLMYMNKNYVEKLIEASK